jgi:hypothetical protein
MSCMGNGKIGQIDRRPSFTSTGSRWLWALNRIPVGMPEAMRLVGVTDTLEQAQAALKESWDEWLAWAHLAPRSGGNQEDETTEAGGS